MLLIVFISDRKHDNKRGIEFFLFYKLCGLFFLIHCFYNAYIVM